MQFIQIDDLDSDDGFGVCTSYARNLITVSDGSTITTNILKRYCEKISTPFPTDSVLGNVLTIQYSQHGGSHNKAIFGFLAQFSTGIFLLL